MSLQHYSNVVTNGLVLYLDAANKKSFSASENLLLYSQLFNNIAWSPGSGTTITENATFAPDGTFTADQINTSTYIVQSISAIASTLYTFSVWLKSATGSNQSVLIYIEDNGIIPNELIASTTVTVTNTWQRFSLSATSRNPTSIFRPSIRAGNYFAWGAQLERSTAPTDYTPTTDFALPRVNAWSNLSNSSSNGTFAGVIPTFDTSNSGGVIFNGTSGTCILDDGSNTRFPHDSAWSISLWCKPITQNTTYPGFLIKGNSGASGVLIFYDVSAIWWKHNTTQTQITTRDLNITKNICLTYSGSGNVAAYVNGVNVGTVGTMTATESSSSLILGTGDQLGNVEIYNFAKYNVALTATEVLQNYNALRGRYGL
jgi:hypothetical protein